MRASMLIVILAWTGCQSETQQATHEWTLIVRPGSGAFESAWQRDRWPMGAQPIAGPSGELWMVGVSTVWESSDGLHWEIAGQIPGPARLGSHSVYHEGRLWVLGGQTGQTFVSDAWCSTDGRHWTRRSDPPWCGRRGPALVSFDGWLWLFGGTNANQLNDVWRTRDGDDWEQVMAQGPWPAESQPVAMVFRDSIWALTGSSWNARDASVWVSADGEHWERAVDSSPWGPRVFVGALAFDDRLWILGGVHPDGRRLNDVWTSRDGYEWRQIAAAAPWTRRAGNRVVVYRGGLWLFGGKGEQEDGRSGYASDIWRLDRHP